MANDMTVAPIALDTMEAFLDLATIRHQPCSFQDRCAGGLRDHAEHAEVKVGERQLRIVFLQSLCPGVTP